MILLESATSPSPSSRSHKEIYPQGGFSWDLQTEVAERRGDLQELSGASAISCGSQEKADDHLSQSKLPTEGRRGHFVLGGRVERLCLDLQSYQ